MTGLRSALQHSVNKHKTIRTTISKAFVFGMLFSQAVDVLNDSILKKNADKKLEAGISTKRKTIS